MKRIKSKFFSEKGFSFQQKDAFIKQKGIWISQKFRYGSSPPNQKLFFDTSPDAFSSWNRPCESSCFFKYKTASKQHYVTELLSIELFLAQLL